MHWRVIPTALIRRVCYQIRANRMQVTSTVLGIKVVDSSKKSGSFACLPTSLAHHGRSRARNPCHARLAFIEFLSFSKSQLPIFTNLIIDIPSFKSCVWQYGNGCFLNSFLYRNIYQ